jgi:hypothetical protein
MIEHQEPTRAESFAPELIISLEGANERRTDIPNIRSLQEYDNLQQRLY